MQEHRRISARIPGLNSPLLLPQLNNSAGSNSSQYNSKDLSPSYISMMNSGITSSSRSAFLLPQGIADSPTTKQNPKKSSFIPPEKSIYIQTEPSTSSSLHAPSNTSHLPVIQSANNFPKLGMNLLDKREVSTPQRPSLSYSFVRQHPSGMQYSDYMSPQSSVNKSNDMSLLKQIHLHTAKIEKLAEHMKFQDKNDEFSLMRVQSNKERSMRYDPLYSERRYQELPPIKTESSQFHRDSSTPNRGYISLIADEAGHEVSRKHTETEDSNKHVSTIDFLTELCVLQTFAKIKKNKREKNKVKERKRYNDDDEDEESDQEKSEEDLKKYKARPRRLNRHNEEERREKKHVKSRKGESESSEEEESESETEEEVKRKEKKKKKSVKKPSNTSLKSKKKEPAAPVVEENKEEKLKNEKKKKYYSLAKARQRLFAFAWHMAYPNFLAKYASVMAIKRRETIQKIIQNDMEMLLRSAQAYLVAAGEKYLRELVTETKSLELYNPKKPISDKLLDVRANFIYTNVKGLFDKIIVRTSEASLTPTFLKFLISISEDFGILPRSFMFDFEVKRLQFDTYGNLQNMTSQRTKMIVGCFILIRVLIHRIILRPWTVFQDVNSSKVNKKNLQIIASILYHLAFSYFKRTVAIQHNNQVFLGAEYKNKPRTDPLRAFGKLKDDLDLEHGQEDHSHEPKNHLQKEPDLITGLLPLDHLKSFFHDRRKLAEELKAFIEGWHDKVYEVVHEAYSKIPKPDLKILGLSK